MQTECEFDPDHLYHEHREADALRAKIERLRTALRQILEDPEARLLDSHRDDGWAALAGDKAF